MMMWHEHPGVAERFESKIRRTEGCWIWTGGSAGGKTGARYGIFRISHPVRRQAYAHRLTLERKLGRALERTEYALHSCDNPMCVNPDHLSLGNQFKNMAEASERGRIAHGETVPWSKLSHQDVREIRALLVVPGALQRGIAERYGVCRPVISNIKSGRTWRHVT